MSNNQLPSIYRNIREFLTYRGATHEIVEQSDREIQDLFVGVGPQKFQGQLKDGSEVIVAVFTSASRYLKGSKEFLAAISALKPSNTREVLVVLGPDVPVRTSVKYTVAGNNKLAEFGRVVSYRIFLTNLPTMAIIPRHRALSEAEAVSLEQHYYMGRDGIASHILWQTDPACIWCGAKRNDIVEIYRNSDTSGSYIDYRLCV
jgi:DNA-directed RNA polymerase subunit H (RpoH/RPB5)